MDKASLSLQQNVKSSAEQRLEQKLTINPQMQQALRILQLPVQELAMEIAAQIEMNPLLDYSYDESEEEPSEEREDGELLFSEKDYTLLEETKEDLKPIYEQQEFYCKPSRKELEQRLYQESLIEYEKPFSEELFEQAREIFPQEKWHTCQILIASLDERGFLGAEMAELATLTGKNIQELNLLIGKLKTLDPPGIFAANLQESLLIQLQRGGKEKSFAYKIVNKYFDLLLHNKQPQIIQKLRISKEQLKEAFEDILHLHLHPASTKTPAQDPVIPDLFITENEEEELIVRVNQQNVPDITINRSYTEILQSSACTKEEQEFIKKNVSDARWLLKNLKERYSTLQKIGVVLAKRQNRFFKDAFGRLLPLTLKIVSEDISLHESTIARAIQGKYLQCDRGVFPIKSFFSSSLHTRKGEEVSSQTAKDIIAYLIKEEDKTHPLSDRQISEELEKRGISCARRTVAKYRTQLDFGSTQQRKSWH